MGRIEGSSTQTFKGEETQLLELLEAREAALVEAQADLEALHDDTDDALERWESCYCLGGGDDDESTTGGVVQADEAKLLLSHGISLHDFANTTRAHRDHITRVSDRFDFGIY
jgi:hypothetical protein